MTAPLMTAPPVAADVLKRRYVTAFRNVKDASATHQGAPLIQAGGAVDVVGALDVLQGRAGFSRVPVAREHHRVATEGGQRLQAAEHVVDVAAREVGAPAPVQEQGVARDQAAVEQEALAARGV